VTTNLCREQSEAKLCCFWFKSLAKRVLSLQQLPPLLHLPRSCVTSGKDIDNKITAHYFLTHSVVSNYSQFKYLTAVITPFGGMKVVQGSALYHRVAIRQFSSKTYHLAPIHVLQTKRQQTDGCSVSLKRSQGWKVAIFQQTAANFQYSISWVLKISILPV